MMRKIIILFLLLSTLIVNAQEDKTVTLTVSGTGKTLEEAKTNALRSAIEQAFGAFISSKTEILNDNLVKDEIVSVSNGNIKNYNVITQTEIPNNGFAITLNTTVSIDKLTTFAQSKGVSIEVNGELFAANITQQELNEKAELIALKNILNTSNELLKKSFDYTIESNDKPIAVQNNTEVFNIPLTVKIKLNKNYTNFNEYFFQSMSKLCISIDEIKTYEDLGIKKDLIILFDSRGNPNYLFLRNKKSFDELNNFIFNIYKSILNFNIFDGNKSINGLYPDSEIDIFRIYLGSTIQQNYEYYEEPSLISNNTGFNFQKPYSKAYPNYGKKEINLSNYINLKTNPDTNKRFKLDKKIYFKFNKLAILNFNNFDFYKILKRDSKNEFPDYFFNENLIAVLIFNDLKTIDELKKLSKYSIKIN